MRRKMTLDEVRSLFNGRRTFFDCLQQKLEKQRKDIKKKGKQIRAAIKKWNCSQDPKEMINLVKDFILWFNGLDANFKKNQDLNRGMLRDMARLAKKWLNKEMWRDVKARAPKRRVFKKRAAAVLRRRVEGR